MKKVKILGLGTYLPTQVISNKDLEKIVDTSDDWIFERTGIRERRRCSGKDGEWPADMAFKATQKALKMAKLNANDIDLIIFASVTPDYKLPNSACVLQTKLGITNQCGCMDIAVGCSGFIYALGLARALIRTGENKNILIACSEMLSREVDWKDRNTCILFGDGCGVAIVGENNNPEDPANILASHLAGDGTGAEFFDQPIGGAVNPIETHHIIEGSHFMRMKGREMFKVATRTLAENARTILKKANIGPEQIDWMIPHQANARIIETTAKLLDFPMDKVIVNIEKYANTSAATIPIALYEAHESGKIKRGDTLLFDTFGAGLTSGATVLIF